MLAFTFMFVPIGHLRALLTLFLLCLMTLTGAAEDMDCVREFPAAYSLLTGAEGEKRDQRLLQTHAIIAAKLHLTPEAVGKVLQSLVESLRKKTSGLAKLDRARASFIHGSYDEARNLALETGDEAHRAAPRRPQDIIASLQLAAFAAMELSRFEEAVKYLGVALGETDADRDLKTWTQLQAATARCYGLMKMHKDEEQTVRFIYTEHERIRGERDPETIKYHSQFAGLLYQNGRDADAERETRAVLKITEMVLGPKHEQTLVLRKNLARVLEAGGRAAEAESLRRMVIAVQMETLGGGAAGTLRSREQLVKNLLEQKKFGEAEAEALILTEHSGKANGPDSTTTLGGRLSVALAILSQERHEQALAQLESLQTDCVRVFGEEHPQTLRVRHGLGTCLNALKQHDQAEAVLADVFKIRKSVLPADDLDTLDTQYQLAIALLRQKKIKPARAEISLLTNSYKRLLVEGDPRQAAVDQLSKEFLAIEEGRDLIIGEFTEIVEAKVRTLGEVHPDALTLREGLAIHMAVAGDLKGALALHQKVLALCMRSLGRKDVYTASVMQRVAMTQQSLARYTEALKTYREVFALRKELLKKGDTTLEETRYRIGHCLGHLGMLEEAEKFVATAYLAVKDLPDSNAAYVAEMKTVLDKIRQALSPFSTEVIPPGTLNHSLSLSKADKNPLPIMGAANGGGSSAPAVDPASLIPSGTIQKPVEFKP
ncbi:MAG: tetratricopeptide repeat protein [Verrucomicrobiota bacterium]